MGAILGLAGLGILLLLVLALWMTGAFRPRSQDGPGKAALNTSTHPQTPTSRVPGID